jgi:hypothetical protein
MAVFVHFMSTQDPISPVTDTSADPNPYIRTYAKDFAKLSGTPLAKQQVSKKKDKHEKPIVAEEQGAPLGEMTQAELQYSAEDRHAASAEQEISAELENINPKPVDEESEAIPSEPEVKEEPREKFELPAMKPQVPIANAPAAPEPKEEARESILNRLRSRSQNKPSSDVQLPEMQAIMPTPAVETPGRDLRPVQPPPTSYMSVSSTTPASLPPAMFPPASIPPPPEPLPPPLPKPAAEPAPEPFHSFKTDFADRIDEKHANTFSVLAAEKDSAPQALPSAPKKKSVVPAILGGIVLLIGAGAGLFAAYLYMHSRSPVTINNSVPSLITPDKEVALTGKDPRSAFLGIANQPLQDGNVLVTYITISTTTSRGQIENVPGNGGLLLEALNLPAPSQLLRNIDPSSTLGVVHAGSETRPFFLLRTTSYSRTFSGMLIWEQTMAADLSAFYPQYPGIGSSTPATVNNSFSDDVVQSHSVRVLRDSNGKSIMLYGYTADQQTLIIARDEQAFMLLLTRLASGSK